MLAPITGDLLAVSITSELWFISLVDKVGG